MKIHIVNYEEPRFNGILSKYAYRMKEVLEKMGHSVSVSNSTEKKAEINHHINYRSYKPSGTIDTLMVTHITTDDKFESIQSGMKTAKKGICFSKDTENFLKRKGIKNLCTILPAHDGYKRKMKNVLISTNVYPDGCKREHMFYELLKHIDCNQFHFYIMGSGWDLQGLNANISYLDHFDKDDYEQLLSICQYSLYFGEDEGSMGILDAKNVGLSVICPSTGFHKYIDVDYPFSTQNELQAIFYGLQSNPVREWTWENYCNQHIKIWEKLVK